MNQAVIWLILFIVFVIIEIATMGLATIWFAGGALLSAIAAMLNAPIYVQVTLFLVVSVVLLIFTRPIAVKYFNKDRVKTNAEGLIGKQCIVISEIDNLEGTGQVTLEGQEWTARAADEAAKIPVGAVAKVVSISGVKLIVEEMAR